MRLSVVQFVIFETGAFENVVKERESSPIPELIQSFISTSAYLNQIYCSISISYSKQHAICLILISSRIQETYRKVKLACNKS